MSLVIQQECLCLEEECMENFKKRSNANISTSLDSHWSVERVFSRRQNHTTFLFNTGHLVNECSECFPITDAYIIVSLCKTHAHTQYSCSILSHFVQHGLLKKKKQVFMNLLKTANQSKPNSAVKEAIQTRNLGSH